MHKIVTALASAAALALLASAAQADCYGAHNVTASADDGKQVIAMSTVTAPVLQPVVEKPRDEAAATPSVCVGEENDCTPGTE